MTEQPQEQTPPVGGDQEGETGTPPPTSETAETQAQAGPTNEELKEAQEAGPGTEGNDDTSQLTGSGEHRSGEEGPPVGAGR